MKEKRIITPPSVKKSGAEIEATSRVFNLLWGTDSKPRFDGDTGERRPASDVSYELIFGRELVQARFEGREVSGFVESQPRRLNGGDLNGLVVCDLE